MNEYRGKHAPAYPWPVASSASVPSRRGRHRKKNHRRRVGFFIIFVLILAVVIYPFAETKIVTVDKFEIKTSSIHLPDNMEFLRVVYVSDIHWGYWYSDWDLSRLISKINDLYPHVLIFGGDYATDFDSAIRFFEKLRGYKLNARLKIYGVLGETEYIGDDVNISRLKDAMKNANVIPLVDMADSINLIAGDSTNENDIVRGKICIVGADDLTGGSPDLKTLAYSREISSAEYVIFAAHNPAIIPTAQKQTDRNNSFDWFELGLFGHTHGGQVRFFSGMLELAEDVPEQYLEGKLFQNRSWLLISRGIGTSVMPCRLFCYPQIHCIDITND